VVFQLDSRPVAGRLVLNPERAVARTLTSGRGGRIGSAARAVSLIAASATALVLIAAPFLVVDHMGVAAHAVLPILLSGMSIGFAHGCGLRLGARLWRVAFSPFTAWPLMAGGWWALLALR